MASLKPLIISLGSSRKLWEDEPYIDSETIIYESAFEKFFSDVEISEEAVYELALELLTKMKGTCRPYILGTECDVLCARQPRDNQPQDRRNVQGSC